MLVIAALCIDQCCIGECAHLCALCCVKGEQKRLSDSKVSEISRLSSRLDQLTEQNNVLHRELEEVTSKMTQLQRRQEREDEQTRALSHSVDVTMSPDRLQPVIKYVSPAPSKLVINRLMKLAANI